MVVMEWFATMLLFILIQPFERWWMGADTIRRRSGRTTVLLVHGYCCNRGFWWWLRSGTARRVVFRPQHSISSRRSAAWTI